MDKEVLKGEYKKAGYGIVYVIILIFIIRFFNLSFWTIILLLLVVNAIFMLAKHEFSIKTLGKNAILLIGLFSMYKWLGNYALIGYIVSVIVISAIILWQKRDRYLEIKWHIESMIWGKPLKDFKTRADIPKIKFVLNKNKEDH